MDKLIVKHFYSDYKNDYFSDIYFDIFDNYKSLYDFVVATYSSFCESQGIDFYESNILLYRCGSISTLGEFRIYSNPLPINLKDIKETF